MIDPESDGTVMGGMKTIGVVVDLADLNAVPTEAPPVRSALQLKHLNAQAVDAFNIKANSGLKFLVDHGLVGENDARGLAAWLLKHLQASREPVPV